MIRVINKTSTNQKATCSTLITNFTSDNIEHVYSFECLDILLLILLGILALENCTKSVELMPVSYLESPPLPQKHRCFELSVVSRLEF